MFIAGGWMTSMNFVPRAECDDEKHILDARLYDVRGQAIAEFEEESGLSRTAGQFSISTPFGIVRDLDTGFNLAISYAADIKEPSARVREIMEKGLHEGRDEYDRVFMLPVSDLDKLLLNQAQLVGKNPLTYESAKPEEQILLHEAIGGFVAAHQTLTGRSVERKTLDKLAQAGINIVQKDTSIGTHQLD